ncbi:hypothetical protein P3T36_004066 [Kitasatospora sp. MAP12-15]|uniref:hypothetical protein n=1 Tax=unclassified Kitasatospora TaxID=2633591 RepID=UPI002475DC55|nr:hypothetical protein [Kitasatospora sp. MAP12-44]MDH6115147.1 hypothetical protein [Kitasatospora sp. MAP12-44]
MKKQIVALVVGVACGVSLLVGGVVLTAGTSAAQPATQHATPQRAASGGPCC